MGRRRYRWSNDDYDQSSYGSYSRNRCDSGEGQIKYRDRSRDRYNGYYLNKYRERLGIGIDMKEETGQGIFIKMNIETGLLKCIEKMEERIAEKKLIKRNQRHKSRDRYFSGHDRWENVNCSHSRSPSSSKLNFEMSKIGDSARCGECEKLTILLKIVLICLNN